MGGGLGMLYEHGSKFLDVDHEVNQDGLEGREESGSAGSIGEEFERMVLRVILSSLLVTPCCHRKSTPWPVAGARRRASYAES